MAKQKKSTNHQVYNLNEDPALLSQVASAVCVFMQRGLMVAAFGAANEVLTVHYHGYNRNRPLWEIEFFEQLFAQQPLATIREKVKGAFILAEKNMVIPDALYKEKEAKEWLKHIHYVEAKDTILSYHFTAEQVHYMVAVPPFIVELVKINSKKATVQPMAVYQFRDVPQQGLYAACCITPEQACITLHNDGKLLWHKVNYYSNVEDIAYEIKHLCRESNISDDRLSLQCFAISAAEFDVASALSRYFPGAKASSGTATHAWWQPAVSLAQQLLSCVS